MFHSVRHSLNGQTVVIKISFWDIWWFFEHDELNATNIYHEKWKSSFPCNSFRSLKQKNTFFHRFPDFMLRGCWIRQTLSIFQPKQHAICFFLAVSSWKESKDILKLLEIIKKTYHYCFRVNYAKLSKIYEGWIETCRTEFLQISFCNMKTCTQNFYLNGYM